MLVPKIIHNLVLLEQWMNFPGAPESQLYFRKYDDFKNIGFDFPV